MGILRQIQGAPQGWTHEPSRLLQQLREKVVRCRRKGTSRSSFCVLCHYYFLNGPSLASFSFIFVFQTNITFLTTNKRENMSITMWFWDLK